MTSHGTPVSSPRTTFIMFWSDDKRVFGKVTLYPSRIELSLGSEYHQEQVLSCDLEGFTTASGEWGNLYYHSDRSEPRSPLLTFTARNNGKEVGTFKLWPWGMAMVSKEYRKLGFFAVAY